MYISEHDHPNEADVQWALEQLRLNAPHLIAPYRDARRRVWENTDFSASLSNEERFGNLAPTPPEIIELNRFVMNLFPARSGFFRTSIWLLVGKLLWTPER